MSKIWRCELDVQRYADLGKKLPVPRQSCPTCDRQLTWWGWYPRWVRWLAEAGEVMERRIWIRRGHCGGGCKSHALLPDFLHEWRKDAVEGIGQVLEATVEKGQATVHVAARMGLPFGTVRNWRCRHRERAGVLFEGFGRLGVELGAELTEIPRETERAALAALRASFQEGSRRWGNPAVGGLWRWWSRASGGRPLGRRAPTFLGSARAP